MFGRKFGLKEAEAFLATEPEEEITRENIRLVLRWTTKILKVQNRVGPDVDKVVAQLNAVISRGGPAISQLEKEIQDLYKALKEAESARDSELECLRKEYEEEVVRTHDDFTRVVNRTHTSEKTIRQEIEDLKKSLEGNRERIRTLLRIKALFR